MNRLVCFILPIATALVFGVATVHGQTAEQDASVRALLFYSPSCPHCHEVIEEHMPTILQEYSAGSDVFMIPPSEEEEVVGPPIVAFMGDDLELLYVNTATQLGFDLFDSAIEVFDIPAERQAVPTVIVGSTLLLGIPDIPVRFPVLISEGLAEGGIAWPPLDGLEEAISSLELVPEVEGEEGSAGESDGSSDGGGGEEAAGSAPSDNPGTGSEEGTGSESGDSSGGGVDGQDEGEASSDEGAGSSNPGREARAAGQGDSTTGLPQGLVRDASTMAVGDRFMLDPVGNSFSVIVLAGLVLSVLWTGRRLRVDAPSHSLGEWRAYGIPLLAMFGLVVAAYLGYVETSGVEATCGPVGDCNVVQDSKYAVIFGVHVGVIGVLGYIAVIAAWYASQQDWGRMSDWAALALFGFALFGVLFSTYLTFLEPFVIGATCMWCLTSAVVMALLLLLTADQGKTALRRLVA